MGDAQHEGISTERRAQLRPDEAAVAMAAYRAARRLLDDAEEQAAGIVAAAEARAASLVAAAERTARSREHEAELLVGRARRVLVAAEQKAAVVLADARHGAPEVIDLTATEPIDRVATPRSSAAGRGSFGTRVDQIVASAVAQAVDEALAATADPSADRPA